VIDEAASQKEEAAGKRGTAASTWQEIGATHRGMGIGVAVFSGMTTGESFPSTRWVAASTEAGQADSPGLANGIVGGIG